jgi:nitric oxide reductase subunit C
VSDGRRSFGGVAVLVGLVAVLGVWWLVVPPRPLLNALKSVEVTAEVGAGLVDRYGCRDCHPIDGEGAIKAPDLAGVTLRPDDPDRAELRRWLRDPDAVRPGTAMPNFRLSDTEIDAIVTFLVGIDGG